MKPLVAIPLLILPLAVAVQLQRGSSDVSLAQQGNRAVGDVIRMLETMKSKAETEAESERKLYAKFKCYCDDNEKEKTDTIETATKNIALLENELDNLLGSNAELSQEVAQLQADMDKNAAARTAATTLRGQENAAYLTEEGELQTAIGQLGQAIGALAAIGGDQSMASEAHTKFMAGYDPEVNKPSLVGLSSSLRAAMLAAGSSLKQGQRETIEALLQQKAPFAGTYVAQSGEVVGILKQMKETFESNLKEATAAEAAAATAHTKWDGTKTSEWNTMDGQRSTKAGDMGTNDGDIGTKRSSLSTEKTAKDDAVDFLDKLQPMCEEKKKDYDQRVMWRAKEAAIIAQAIAMLNSDHAFDSFGKVNATSFLQLSSGAGRSMTRAQLASAAKPVSSLLLQAAREQHSARLARIGHLLAAGNPFKTVLVEIAKIKKVLEAEGQADLDSKNWCESERTSTDGAITTKGGEVTTLDGDITQLGTDIDHPDTGLKAAIAEHEASLETNRQAMIDETKTRREENVLYQQNVGDCVEAAALLDRAVKLLTKFYDQLEADKAKYYASSLAQADPAPPSTWTGEYEGLRSEAGTDIVTELETLRDNSVAEETTLHTNEMAAQHAFEDSMGTLTSQDETTKTNLATAKKNLATKQKELGEKRAEKDDVEKQIVELNRYLDEIKPGCDFIATNFDDRKTNRQAEDTALDTAVTKIKAMKAYTNAEAKEKEESFGRCKETCVKDEMHVDCQSCLKDISVPGYCAANPSTPGC